MPGAMSLKLKGFNASGSEVVKRKLSEEATLVEAIPRGDRR